MVAWELGTYYFTFHATDGYIFSVLVFKNKMICINILTAFYARVVFQKYQKWQSRYCTLNVMSKYNNTTRPFCYCSKRLRLNWLRTLLIFEYNAHFWAKSPLFGQFSWIECANLHKIWIECAPKPHLVK